MNDPHLFSCPNELRQAIRTCHLIKELKAERTNHGVEPSGGGSKPRESTEMHPERFFVLSHCRTSDPFLY